MAGPSPRTGAATHDGLKGRRRWFSTLAIVLGVVMTVLANATTYVALPSMARSLGVDAGVTVWVINLYLLATVVALLPVAAWGDTRGHRRVFLAGLALFAAATVLAALSARTPWPLPTLLLARALMGLGAAGVMATCMALLRATHPSHRLGRFIGLNGMAVAAANAAGPSVAGAVLAWSNWETLLALLLVPAAATAVLGWRSLPRNPVLREAAVDPLGAVLQGAAFASLVLVLTPLAGAWRWPLCALGLALGAAFVLRERQRGFALLPLDLLKRPLFAASFTAAYACFVAQVLAMVCLPFLLQGRLGLGPGATGLAITPWPLAVMVTAPLAGALSDRVSTAWLGSTGLLLAAAGLVSLAWLPGTATALDVAWRMALTGAGFALFSGSNVRALMAATPVERSGAVGGMHAISRQSGQLVGAALGGLVLSPAGWAGAADRGLLLAALMSGLAAVACGFKSRDSRGRS